MFRAAIAVWAFLAVALPVSAAHGQQHPGTGAYWYCESTPGEWVACSVEIDLGRIQVSVPETDVWYEARPTPYLFLGAHGTTTNAEAGLYYRAGKWWVFAMAGGGIGWSEPSPRVGLPADSRVRLRFTVMRDALTLHVLDRDRLLTWEHSSPVLAGGGFGDDREMRMYREISLAEDPGHEDFHGDPWHYFGGNMANASLFSGRVAGTDGITARAWSYPLDGLRERYPAAGGVVGATDGADGANVAVNISYGGSAPDVPPAPQPDPEPEPQPQPDPEPEPEPQPAPEIPWKWPAAMALGIAFLVWWLAKRERKNR